MNKVKSGPNREGIAMTSTSRSQQNTVLKLLAAIVEDGTTIEDGIAQLKSEGIDSLESALAILRGGLKSSQAPSDMMKPIDIHGVRQNSSPDPVRSVHKAPKVPFILNGTTYDPEDIGRFDGQELHYIATPGQDHMLVVDDPELITTWRQLLYLDRYRQGGNRRTLSAEPVGRLNRSDRTYPRTWFFDDAGWQGHQIYLDANRGYDDLTNVSTWLWPFANWNDRISSVWLIGTRVAVLHDNVGWSGESLTLQIFDAAYELMIGDLTEWGWNDRASSLETW
ncbi:hypothetical protein [Streptomyces sp. NPDC060031]|uniref:hypothetical protein n=1 Tax=Streptomyces sp. NPDC060031 TaxID=3347043 RepID=UPI003683045E